MKIKWLLLALCWQAIAVNAGVMPAQSRIIYHAGDKERSLMLANTNEYPVVVQNWIDRGEGTPETEHIPFVSVPSVLRLAPSDVQGVRIIYNQTPLPRNIESLFWFNIYEIPPERKGAHPDNSVLVTMNTQLKLFFRPAGLTLVPEEAIKQVNCTKKSASEIECSNPSPIHLSVINIKISQPSGKTQPATGSDFMLLPESKKLFHFRDPIANAQKLTLVYLNDAGEAISYDTDSLD